MLELLRFPVLTISQGCALVYNDPTLFGFTHKLAVKRRYWDEMLLVDSTGVAYRIRSYDFPSIPFWKRPKTPLGRATQLQNIVLEETPMSFDEVRERVLTCIDQHPELYDGAGEPEDLARDVQKTSSIAELLTTI